MPLTAPAEQPDQGKLWNFRTPHHVPPKTGVTHSSTCTELIPGEKVCFHPNHPAIFVSHKSRSPTLTFFQTHLFLIPPPLVHQSVLRPVHRRFSWSTPTAVGPAPFSDDQPLCRSPTRVERPERVVPVRE